MHVRTFALAIVSSALVAVAAMAPVPAAAADRFTVTALHFRTVVGPEQDKVCDVVGDLYLPKSAKPSKRVPALLTTNGFGGSKDDQAGIGREFASRGYAVLSYSGLGFGGSDCQITLDDREHDGAAASQLVSYLGGAEGIAFTDDTHTTPAPVLDVVQLDDTDHLGVAREHDPRVGMVGGSYGGQVQYAAAAIDSRIDTIVPIITWSDLSYSLAPNNTDLVRGVTSDVSGVSKLVWALGFTAFGVANGLQNLPTDPLRIIPCPNFTAWVCPSLAVAGTIGTPDATTIQRLRNASVASYVEDVRVPTLIIQGQSDTLFNLNEGVATYEALQAQGTETKMVWMQGGHSGESAPGEIAFNAPDPTTQHLARRVLRWFDHHLKGKPVSTGPEFTYFRDWVNYTGIAAPAYKNAATFPVGNERRFYLGGTELTSKRAQVSSAAQAFVTPPAGLPTSTDVADVVGGFLPLPAIDVPGTFAAWSTPPLDSKLDVVGLPTLDLRVDAPTAVLTQGVVGTKLVLFVKMIDVAPDGSASVVRDLIAPVRVPDVREPFSVTLPGFVHRFESGHRIKLVVAGGSVNYRGGLAPVPVSIGGGTHQVLTLPVVR